jgi:hypothetical protein
MSWLVVEGSQHWGLIMQDPLGNAIRYQERAADCDYLADTLPDDGLRAYYRKLADDYLDMARTELKRAEREIGHKASVTRRSSS